MRMWNKFKNCKNECVLLMRLFVVLSIFKFLYFQQLIINFINYIIYIRQMGQQQSKAQQSIKRNQIKNYKKTRFQYHLYHPQIPIQHQSILKIKQFPFTNSTQISLQPPLFLENIDLSLAHLISSRLYTTKLFTEQDIFKLIQTVIYALTYLDKKNIFYTNLSTSNIFYDTQNGVFKLLPNQLIKQSAYDLALYNKKKSYLSPQLIVALRYKQRKIQRQIYNKSNIFTFGMIILELATLTSSLECYDEQNYDILDLIIQKKLDQVKEFYPVNLKYLIQKMLIYDYTQRMNLKQMSQQVNRIVGLFRKQRQNGDYDYWNVNNSQKNRRVNEKQKCKYEKSQNKQQEKQRINLKIKQTDEQKKEYCQVKEQQNEKKVIIKDNQKKNNQYRQNMNIKKIIDINQLSSPKNYRNTHIQNQIINPNKIHLENNNNYDLLNQQQNIQYSAQKQSLNQKQYFINQNQHILRHIQTKNINLPSKNLPLSNQSTTESLILHNNTVHKQNKEKQYSPLKIEKKIKKYNAENDDSIKKIKEQIQRSRKLIIQFKQNDGLR